jgi:hypothetical protein
MSSNTLPQAWESWNIAASRPVTDLSTGILSVDRPVNLGLNSDDTHCRRHSSRENHDLPNWDINPINPTPEYLLFSRNKIPKLRICEIDIIPCILEFFWGILVRVCVPQMANGGCGLGSDQAAFSDPHDQHVQMHAFWEGACLKLREKGDLFGALSCNRKRGKPLGH